MSARLRVAIVGAGPTGFFAAAALFKSKAGVEVSVDMFDMLPAPFGLVRYGVAPDHPEIKRVEKGYAKTASHEHYRFFGNVAIGEDLSHEELLEHYDQVCYCHGAQSDRSLGIPGEDRPGSYSATEFVAWYNGHPNYCDRQFDLTCENVIVVGVGNVAMDTARILAKSVEELSSTDIADHALEALRDSKVKNIYVLGRRGPVQAKFTTPELRELGDIVAADTIVSQRDLELDELSKAELEGNKVAQRNLKLLEDYAAVGDTGKPRNFIFRFLTSPVEILGDGRVERVRCVRNELRPTETGYLNSHPTDEEEIIECGLVLRSVGYRGVPLPGVPATKKGTLPHDRGRVIDGDQRVERVYVAGWAKRGPSGVIGTNKADAKETVEAMLEDAATLERVPERDVTSLLDERGVDYVTFEQWQRLDEHERAAGEAGGRPRVKVVSRDEMLRIARS